MNFFSGLLPYLAPIVAETVGQLGSKIVETVGNNICKKIQTVGQTGIQSTVRRINQLGNRNFN